LVIEIAPIFRLKIPKSDHPDGLGTSRTDERSGRKSGAVVAWKL